MITNNNAQQRSTTEVPGRERRAYIVAAARTRLSLTDEDLVALGMHDGAGRRVSRELALGILELNALLCPSCDRPTTDRCPALVTF